MVLKRRKNKKTDYKQRLALLKSNKHRLVVRRTLNNIHVQIVKFEPDGDKTVIEVSSKNLIKYGWKAHGGNIPSAYLCGLLAGLQAIKKDVDGAVLDIGLQTSIKGSSIYAVAVGAKDAGFAIDLGKEIAPDMNRISGAHISNYAKTLKSDTSRYNRQFSLYLKNGIDPEKLPEHFEEVKRKMLEEFGFDLKNFVKEGEGEKKLTEKEEAESMDKKEKTETVATVEDADDDEEWEDAE